MCQRLGVLLGHMSANSTAKNIKELIRLLMPFIQGASESIETDEQKLAWVQQNCQVLNTLFERIVVDEAMINVLN